MIQRIVTMARFRRSGIGTLVQRVKHVIDSEGVATAIRSDTPLAIVVNSKTTPTVITENLVGSTINAFFLSVFGIGATGTGVSGSVNWYLAKLRGGQAVSDLPNPGETGTSDLRNQIIHEEKGVPGSADGTPMVFKGVIVVPRGMRRNRSGDEWHLIFRSATSDANFCVKAIYNEFN